MYAASYGPGLKKHGICKMLPLSRLEDEFDWFFGYVFDGDLVVRFRVFFA